MMTASTNELPVMVYVTPKPLNREPTYISKATLPTLQILSPNLKHPSSSPTTAAIYSQTELKKTKQLISITQPPPCEAFKHLSPINYQIP
jgi:hypothetical protein